ncbi:MAG: hypothetical protein ACRD2E_08740 [Terriglobales bacterium]
MGTVLVLALAGCRARPTPVPPTEAQAPAGTVRSQPAPPATPPAPATPAAKGAAAAATATKLPPDPDAASMPAGPGKSDIVTLCTQCHTLHRIVTRGLSRANWAWELHVMQGNGLQATPAQLASILDYLATHYPPQH